MNNSLFNSLTRFAFIYNRFRCSQNGCKTASQVTPNTPDFEIFFTDAEDLKNQLVEPIKKLFATLNNSDKLTYSQKKWIEKIWYFQSQIVDYKTIEDFIVKLINCSGIILKGFSKIFFDNHEYFYYEHQIFKFKANEHTWIHKFDNEKDPFVVIWKSKPQSERYGNQSQQMVRPKITTYEEFYKYFENYPKNFRNFKKPK